MLSMLMSSTKSNKFPYVPSPRTRLQHILLIIIKWWSFICIWVCIERFLEMAPGIHITVMNIWSNVHKHAKNQMVKRLLFKKKNQMVRRYWHHIITNYKRCCYEHKIQCPWTCKELDGKKKLTSYPFHSDVQITRSSHLSPLNS